MTTLAMSRDADDVWPDDRPCGTFDWHVGRIQGKDGTLGPLRLLQFKCPNGRHCGVFVAPTTPASVEPCHVWGWDGNESLPTLTPSVNCLSEKDGKPTGGCGWHGFITAGAMVGA